ncbi:MAG: hypothetical protein C5B52_01950 [Bacteroidetes bacterium]|nr:MAG: hypothetical protein C5B52_01950 [Bacteroidota bacterium]
MKSLKFLAVSFITTTTIMIACKTSSVPEMYNSEKTPGVDFKKYKTYAWRRTADTSYTRFVNRRQFVAVLIPEVMKELESKGLKYDSTNPDCLFQYTLLMKQKYNINQEEREVSYSPQYYQNPYAGYGQNPVYYFSSDNTPAVYAGQMNVVKMKEGTLIIDMIDTKDNKVVWRTSANGERNDEKTGGVEQVVRTIVPEMFRKFPK